MNDNCSMLFDETSSINKSWICKRSNNDSESSDCVYLFDQQFNRNCPRDRYIEGIIGLVICLCGFPTNAAAIRNFSARKGVKNEFKFLIAAFSCANCCLCVVGLIKATARMVDDYPLGAFGCVLSITIGSIILTASVMILALISYERRLSMTDLVVYRPRTGRYAIALPILTLLNSAAWIIAYHIDETLEIFSTPIEGVKNEKPVTVCAIHAERLGTKVRFGVVFFIFTFFVPFSFTVYNYGCIWRDIRRLSRTSLLNRSAEEAQSEELSSANGMAEVLTASVANIQFPNAKPVQSFSRRRQKRDAFLTAIMVVTLIEFIICSTPFQVCINYAFYDSTHGKQFLSAPFYYSCLLFLCDSMLNPLWPSLVRFKAHAKKRPHQGPACDKS